MSKINCDKTDYCKLEEKLCKKGQHHIACSNKSLPPLDVRKYFQTFKNQKLEENNFS